MALDDSQHQFMAHGHRHIIFFPAVLKSLEYIYEVE